jgi:cell volume regulation protein A
MLDSMAIVVLIASALVVASIFTSFISFRFGAPLLLVFLVLGLLAGEDGVGGIAFNDHPAAFFIGSVALAIILFDSGFETRLATLRIAAGPAIVLATAGVVATAALVGVAARFLFDLAWPEAFLLGAIVAPTDAAAVFFLLRVGGITLRDRVRSTLEIESGTNDPVAIFLTISLVGAIAGSGMPAALPLDLAGSVVLQVVVGSAIGVAGGLAIVAVVNRAELEAALYPIVVIALALAVWAVAGLGKGSGFLAVYLAGLIAGNAHMRHTGALKRFQRGVTWLSQIAMFLTLGLLATPSQFGRVLVPAMALAVVLTFFARPAAVWLCLLPFGFTRHEIAFVSWVGLRGAVSILLAILPVIAGLPHGQDIFNTAFIIVLVSLLLQGWTIRPMANWLGMVVPARPGAVDRFELELPGRGDYEIVAYQVHADSPVATGHRIPRWARPSLLIRDGRSLRPHLAGRPQAGDQVYVITTPEFVGLLDQLFASGGAHPDDPRLFGEFGIAVDARLAALAAVYGFVVNPGDEQLTVAELLRRELAGDIETGDRIAYGLVDLIVRRVGKDHAIEEVGLALEHEQRTRPRMPLFQSWREIRSVTRRWLVKLKRVGRRRGASGE